MQNRKQDEKSNFLIELNADILNSLTQGGRIKNAAGLAGELLEITEVGMLYGIPFHGYLAKIETQRPMGTKDEVIVAFTDAVIDPSGEIAGFEMKKGSRIILSGRQQALKDYHTGKVLVYILADYISLSPKAPPQNDIALVGELAYKPIYRRTPKGTCIADIFVKTENVLTGKECYIPCICWHGAAEMAAGWQ